MDASGTQTIMPRQVSVLSMAVYSFQKPEAQMPCKGPGSNEDLQRFVSLIED